MIEAFYEESAVNAKAKSGEKKYKVLNVFATIFLILGIITLASLIFTIPIEPSQSNYNTPQEYQKAMEAYQFALSMTVFLASNTIFFWGMWAVFFFWKRKVNISFDFFIFAPYNFNCWYIIAYSKENCKEKSASNFDLSVS